MQSLTGAKRPVDELFESPPRPRMRVFLPSHWITKLQKEFPYLSKGDLALSKIRPRIVCETLARVDTFQPVKTWKVQLPTSSHLSVKLSPEHLFISSGHSPWIQVWDIEKRTNPISIVGLNSPVNKLKVKYNRLFAISGGQVKSWGGDSLDKVVTFGRLDTYKQDGHTGDITSLLIVNDNLYTASLDHFVNQWVLDTGACYQAFSLKEPILQIKMWREYLLYAKENSGVALMNSYTYLRESNFDYGIVPTKIKVYGNALFILSRCSGVVKMIDLEAKALKYTFSQHNTPPSCMQIVEKRLFVGFGDGAVRVWDTEKGNLLHTLKGHSKNVKQLKVVAHRLLTLSEDKTVKVWDVENERILTTIENGEHMSWFSCRLAVIGGNTAQIFDFSP